MIASLKREYIMEASILPIDLKQEYIHYLVRMNILSPDDDEIFVKILINEWGLSSFPEMNRCIMSLFGADVNDDKYVSFRTFLTRVVDF